MDLGIHTDSSERRSVKVQTNAAPLQLNYITFRDISPTTLLLGVFARAVELSTRLAAAAKLSSRGCGRPHVKVRRTRTEGGEASAWGLGGMARLESGGWTGVGCGLLSRPVTPSSNSQRSAVECTRTCRRREGALVR